jgi:acetyl esterase/lipase
MFPTLPLRAAGVLLAFALVACGSGGEDSPVVIEQITVDASAVQARAPASAGNTTAGTAEGLLAYYRDSIPTRLVVLAHGYRGNVQDGSWHDRLEQTARPDTVVLAMNYRDNLRFPTLRGAHDVVAATLAVKQRFPTIRTEYLWGWSMGGGITGTALTESAYVTPDGLPLFDYWIDVEGVNNLAELWTWFSSQTDSQLAQELTDDIEDETGGTPAQAQAEYDRRSPSRRVDEMRDPVTGNGLRALVVLHAANDGIVLYNQAAELAQTASGVGIPVLFITIGTHAPDEEKGGQLVLDTGVSGHSATPVIRTAFRELESMLNGTYDESTPYRDCRVDDNADGTTTETCSPPR